MLCFILIFILLYVHFRLPLELTLDMSAVSISKGSTSVAPNHSISEDTQDPLRQPSVDGLMSPSASTMQGSTASSKQGNVCYVTGLAPAVHLTLFLCFYAFMCDLHFLRDISDHRDTLPSPLYMPLLTCALHTCI